MFRILTIALGAAAMAASASAADFVVQTQGKSPAEIHAAIADAAHKACVRALSDDVLAIYRRPGCERDTIAAAMVKAPLGETAMNTRGSNTVR